MPEVEAIYLDNAASAPLDPRVAACMRECLEDPNLQGNPHAIHGHGRAARQLVETARAQCAALVSARPQDIVFTSGATEANNMAILGAARAAPGGSRHFISAATEHKSVVDPLRQLQREGCSVTWLPVDGAGLIDPQTLRAAFRHDTVLVALLQVNNETGVCQDLGTLGALCAEQGVALHVDAVQGAGKIDCVFGSLNAATLAYSGHKLHGPKGIGVLVAPAPRRAALQPLVFGGGQEWGLRSGTLAVHQIVGLGLASELARIEGQADAARVGALRQRLWHGLSALPDVRLNGHPTQRAPGILNVSFGGVEGESLLFDLPTLAVSTGSACDSANAEGSYVLRAMGRSSELAGSSLRFSLGRFSTAAEVDAAIAAVSRAVTRLRALAP